MHRASLWLSLLCVLILGMVGCGKSGPERIPLSGKVTYNGEPIEDGEIAFQPEPGTDAPPTSAPILDGEYKLSPNFEMVPGTYKVMIRAYQIEFDEKKKLLPGGFIDRPPPPNGIDVKAQLLPEKFNTKTEIEKLTVESGAGPVEQNYDLKDK